MDHDRLFKELLTTFFAEFLDLFLPNVASELDRDHVEFIDKEVFSDIGSGEQHEVDLLAKVRLLGREAFILIHVENQSTARPDFPQRMFRYFSLIHGKYALPVFPIALFSYDRPLVPASDRYEVKLFGVPILRFQFHPIQLNTLNWRQYVNRPNPVASALMVKMKFEPRERPRVKLECLRMLATLKLDPARTRLIGVFMNSYLKLAGKEATAYTDDMQKVAAQENDFDEEVKKELKRLNWAEMCVRLLERRYGDLPTDLFDSTFALTIPQAEEFLEAFPTFKNVNDAEAWVAKNAK